MDDFEFKCNDGTCIPINEKCNGQIECTQGEDEENCNDPNYSDDCDGFQCEDGRCISNEAHCNGQPDCSNGEDEEDCTGKIYQLQNKKSFNIIESRHQELIGRQNNKNVENLPNFVTKKSWMLETKKLTTSIFIF